MGEWQIPGSSLKLVNVHEEHDECRNIGCMIHNPTDHVMNREEWPYSWRDDRGMMERICEHGVGHPDLDSVRWSRRHARDAGFHGCDGCCADPDWWNEMEEIENG